MDDDGVVSIVGLSNENGLNELHRFSAPSGGSVGITKLCFGVADVVFFCDLFGLCVVIVGSKIIALPSADCVTLVVVFVVTFDVVAVFEFFVKEKVNGVSATSDLDSIKFLDCANDDI